MSGLAQAVRQIKFENRSFWRNPASAFFTVVFPLIFLVIFNSGLFGDDRVRVPSGGSVDISTYYVPAIAALALISACFTNVAIRTSFARDLGVLKRVRGTPLTPWAYQFGRVAHASLIGMFLVALVTMVGVLLYGVEAPTDKIPALIVTVLVGAACFSALGLAVTAIIPNADASPPVTNFIILPLLLISDVFIPLDQAPEWLHRVAGFFPVLHLSHALLDVFNPLNQGSGFNGWDLSVMGIWFVVGSVLALRFFSWEPRK